MKYDVFISYSRKDMAVAQRVYKALSDVGIECFFDTEDIGLGEDFAQRIANAIFACKAMVFIWSDNSNQSPNTANEIALAIEFDKVIIPFKITKLTTASTLAYHLLKLNRIDAIPVEESHIKELVRKVSPLVGAKESKSTAQTSNISMPTPTPVPAPAPAKTYKVGDYYNENGKEGVVFDVWDGGKHGKIVSLDQAKLQWCTYEQDDKKIVVGATSKTDGKANTDKVMARTDSAEYPAFVWCRNKGKDWYLPAIEELRLLLCNKSVYGTVNKTLESRGAAELFNRSGFGWYWASTEAPNCFVGPCAWYVSMDDGNTYCVLKSSNYYVRAVSAF